SDQKRGDAATRVVRAAASPFRRRLGKMLGLRLALVAATCAVSSAFAIGAGQARPLDRNVLAECMDTTSCSADGRLAISENELRNCYTLGGCPEFRISITPHGSAAGPA